MSKKVNFAKLYAAAQVPPNSNGGLSAQNQTNDAVVIPPPEPAKSLHEAIERGLSTFRRTAPDGRTYTMDVKHFMRVRRTKQLRCAQRKPQPAREPRIDPKVQHDFEQERERTFQSWYKSIENESPGPYQMSLKQIDDMYKSFLDAVDRGLESFQFTAGVPPNAHTTIMPVDQYIKSRREKRELEEELSRGENNHPDSYWISHGMLPPKKKEEHEEEEDIDLGYSDSPSASE